MATTMSKKSYTTSLIFKAIQEDSVNDLKNILAENGVTVYDFLNRKIDYDENEHDDDITKFEWPLSLAVASGSEDIATLFLQNNTDIKRKEEDLSLIHILITYASKQIEKEEKYARIYSAITTCVDSIDTLRELILSKDQFDRRPLELASDVGTYKILLQLLDTEGIYKVEIKWQGIYKIKTYDLSEYDLGGRRVMKSPILKMACLENSSDRIQRIKDSGILDTEVIKKWINSSRTKTLPGVFIMSLLKISFAVFYCLPYPASINLITLGMAVSIFTLLFLAFVPQCYQIIHLYKTKTTLFSNLIAKFSEEMILIVVTFMILYGYFNVSETFWDIMFVPETVGILYFFMDALALVPYIGIFFYGMKKMMKSMLQFMLAFLVMYVAFTSLYYSTETFVKPNTTIKYSDLFYKIFKIMLNLVEFDSKGPSMLLVFHITYVFLINIMLLSFLIAVMADTYAKITSSKEVIMTIQSLNQHMKVFTFMAVFSLIFCRKWRGRKGGFLKVKEFGGGKDQHANEKPMPKAYRKLMTQNYVASQSHMLYM